MKRDIERFLAQGVLEQEKKEAILARLEEVVDSAGRLSTRDLCYVFSDDTLLYAFEQGTNVEATVPVRRVPRVMTQEFAMNIKPPNRGLRLIDREFVHTVSV